jgi:hypothetical protein
LATDDEEQQQMANYLTRDDFYNYGTDLIDFTQRAAAQAVAPHLQALDQQNAVLRQQVAEQTRKAMHQQIEAAVPNWREIDSDPRWYQWLGETDPFTGAMRQQVLDDAIAAGSASRVLAFFNTFQAQHGGAARGSPGRPRSASSQQQVYTRGQIKQLHELHRRGKLQGAEWDRLEQDIIAAAREGRVVGALDPAGR